MEPSSVAANGVHCALDTEPLDEPRIRRWIVRQCLGADPVLDIGCGTGELCADLTRRGHHVTGVDRDPVPLATAERIAAQGGPYSTPTWLQDDGEVLARIGDEQFGAVTLVFVLHHMTDPMAGLRAAWRVLQPDGDLLIAEMLPKGPQAGDPCHRIRLEQWLMWFSALEPAALRLIAPANEEWLLARLGKTENGAPNSRPK